MSKYEFGDKILTLQWAFSPGHGYFYIRPKNSGQVSFHCREEFHKMADGPPTFSNYLYGVSKKTTNDPNFEWRKVLDFVAAVEDTLNLTIRTKFNRTNDSHTILVSPSCFWLEKPMRHSFLTVVLRAAITYSSVNYDLSNQLGLVNAICRHKYAAETRQAVDRFLQGYTEYNYVYLGWHAQFTQPGSIVQLTKPSFDENDRRNIVEKIAKNIWEEKGCPQNQDANIWNDAVEKYISARFSFAESFYTL